MDELLSLFGAADGSQSGDQEVSTTPCDGAHTTDGFGDAFAALSDTDVVSQKSLHKPTAPASTKTAVARTNDNISYDPLTGLRIMSQQSNGDV